jgi:hypothetical protein
MIRIPEQRGCSAVMHGWLAYNPTYRINFAKEKSINPFSLSVTYCPDLMLSAFLAQVLHL